MADFIQWGSNLGRLSNAAQLTDRHLRPWRLLYFWLDLGAKRARLCPRQLHVSTGRYGHLYDYGAIAVCYHRQPWVPAGPEDDYPARIAQATDGLFGMESLLRGPRPLTGRFCSTCDWRRRSRSSASFRASSGSPGQLVHTRQVRQTTQKDFMPNDLQSDNFAFDLTAARNYAPLGASQAICP